MQVNSLSGYWWDSVGGEAPGIADDSLPWLTGTGDTLFLTQYGPHL